MNYLYVAVQTRPLRGKPWLDYASIRATAKESREAFCLGSSWAYWRARGWRVQRIYYTLDFPE